jgi:hypothetical protein
MFIFVTDQELCVCKLMGRIMGYDHSLGRKNILKFIYYYMFLLYYISLNIFLLLVSCNQHMSVIMLLF